MDNTLVYHAGSIPSERDKTAVLHFLHTHLEQYGDTPEDIEKAYNYALSIGNKPGGIVIAMRNNDEIVAASIINKTGMKGYIPENILVYIATHKDHRGKGLASKLMQQIINEVDGDVALHVEHDNPAKSLYEKFGFTNKYLEMRLKKGA